MSVVSSAALDRIIKQMQYLVEHPRIQQKTWVAEARGWLPVLRDVKSELESTQISHQPIGSQELLETLKNIGLEIRQYQTGGWSYSWNGNPLVGMFPSQQQALEADLHDILRKP